MKCKFLSLALVAVCATAGHAETTHGNPTTPPCGPTINASLTVSGRPVTSSGLDIDCFELTQSVASPHLTAGSNGQEPLGGTLTLNSCDCDPAWYEVIKTACSQNDPVELKLWVTFPATATTASHTTSIDLAGLCPAPANPCDCEGCCGHAFTFAAQGITFGLDPGNLDVIGTGGNFNLILTQLSAGQKWPHYSFFPGGPSIPVSYPDVCSFTFLEVDTPGYPFGGVPGKVMANRSWLGDPDLFTLLVDESYDGSIVATPTPPLGFYFPFLLAVHAPTASSPWFGSTDTTSYPYTVGLETQVTIRVTENGGATERACFDYLESN